MYTIPHIGETFVGHFNKIGVKIIADLKKANPEVLYEKLKKKLVKEKRVSKNYLYHIRMAIYYAKGGRDPKKLTWTSWTDK